MKRPFYLAALALSAVAINPVFAQPNPDAPPITENPPNWQQRPNMRDMTPEQRAERMKQMREGALRQMMTMAEIKEKATQDTLLAFLNAEDKAREPITAASRKVIEAVGAAALNRPAATDTEIEILMQEYRDAVEDNTARRKTALDELDGKINWRKSPRIDAFLTLMGYTGEESMMSGGMGGMIGGGGPGGFGGMGGLFGGGPGGFGGGRGGNAAGGRGGNNAFGPLQEERGNRGNNDRPRQVRPAPAPIPHIAPAPANDVD